MNVLDSKISQLEREAFLDSLKTKQELMLLKAQYEELSTSKAENSLIRLKQSYYCWRIKKLDADRAITAFQTQSGAKSKDPQEINDTFSIYYKILYRSESSENLETQSEFLDGLCIPSIPVEGYMDRKLDA